MPEAIIFSIFDVAEQRAEVPSSTSDELQIKTWEVRARSKVDVAVARRAIPRRSCADSHVQAASPTIRRYTSSDYCWALRRRSLPRAALLTLLLRGTLPILKFKYASTGARALLLLAACATWGNGQEASSALAGYLPQSPVTDHSTIDLDQAAFEAALPDQAQTAFDAAVSIYTLGGNSKSYAVLTLASQLTSEVPQGTEVYGFAANGARVNGTVYETASAGASSLEVQYIVGSTLAPGGGATTCRVGGLVNRVTDGCFRQTTDLTIETAPVISTSATAVNNLNGRTLQSFSTNAQDLMYDNCPGCPYKHYKMFYDYYGRFDYVDRWVTAALRGEDTEFRNGNALFTTSNDVDTRREAAQKGTAYMGVWMYVIREFEDAIDDCNAGTPSDNANAAHAWDEGVAFYTGSLEGTDGTGAGTLLYALADKRCAETKTCGRNGNSDSGTSKVNIDILAQFALGQMTINLEECSAVRPILDRIVQLMTVPLVQGSLRY
eukprot:6184425-Pleurochrysis_carterae.AAC.1